MQYLCRNTTSTLLHAYALYLCFHCIDNRSVCTPANEIIKVVLQWFKPTELFSSTPLLTYMGTVLQVQRPDWLQVHVDGLAKTMVQNPPSDQGGYSGLCYFWLTVN